jgi:ribose transport system permease protein
VTAETASPASAPGSRFVSFGRFFGEHPIVVLSIVLIVLILITGALEPNYLSFAGLRGTALFATPIGIMAAGQTILMLTAGIDLSAAMIATAAAYVVANRSVNGAAIAIGFGLLVGVISGAANGVGVGVFRVNPLIMTIAMSGILFGLFSSWAQTFLVGSTIVGDFVKTLGGGSFLGSRIPYAVVVWAAVGLILILMLRYTGFGRMLYALGDNPVATRLSGARPWQILLVAYTLSGVLAAISGILLAGRIGAVDLQLAAGLLLPSVAAAVIGGTSIFGGFGTYSGTILGALILGVLSSMLTFLDAGQAVQQILFGSIVLGLAWLYASITRRA